MNSVCYQPRLRPGKLRLRWTLLAALLLMGITRITPAQNLVAIPPNLAPKDRICFALYTVHERTLKLTAQFYPIKDFEPFAAELAIERDGQWHEVATADILYPGYTATFRVDDWDDTQPRRYRVSHNNTAFYAGTIQANPRSKNEFVLAAFTCNSIYPRHGGDIPRTDIIENLKRVQPDLLFFSGDQVYDHSEHYLHWLKFGRDFGEVIRNTPTICIPDDHDIGQANLWGSGGKRAASRHGEDGGYYMPVSYVQEVERAQTSHLPDPFDPTPIQRGIGVYYTALTWGGISFAIIEDRKFKTGPGEVRPATAEGDVEAIHDPEIDTATFDPPDARLLGERQLAFLAEWVNDWQEAEMKTVLSQTIFSQVCNYSGKHDQELLADFDSNGWPSSGRDRALRVIRKGFACTIAGDQHLGSVVQYGIDDWGDASFSFCTPAIANFWLRWWDPREPGRDRPAGAPRYTGEFLDGFQNKMTVYAVANPTVEEQAEGGRLSTRAAGWGIVRYDKAARTTTFECWPRNVDVTDPASQQYPGWPITITQTDNNAFPDGWELPTLNLARQDQVVKVLAEDGELVSAMRVRGQTYQPRVRHAGRYSLVIGEGEDLLRFETVTAARKNDEVLSINWPQG